MFIPELLILASLIIAAIEDDLTRKVHLLTWIPLGIGALWILAENPMVLLLVLPIAMASYGGIKTKILGGADPFAFGSIALLGFSWSFLYAALAFTFLLIGWSCYLILKRKIILRYKVPAVPLCAIAFLLALIINIYVQ